MYFKNKLNTWQCIAFMMMLAPATVSANTNHASINDDIEYVEIPSASDTSASDTSASETSAWITQVGLHPNTDVLINAIANSESHGLNPERYQLQSLEQELESFVENSEISGSYSSASDALQRIKLEQSLNQAFTLFSRDIGKGVLNARATQKNLYRAAPAVDTEDLLARLYLGEATVHDLLTELTPSTPQYKNLVNHMKALLAERDSGFIRTKARFVEGITVGMEHNSIISLRSRLIETGDLDPNAGASKYFGDKVIRALTAVQTRHGLAVTGELTESTVVALNSSVDDDIEQVAMNLERWRWMPRELGDRHIMVNIPSYNLTMVNDDQPIIDMAVVVGSKKHNTPAFSQGAQYIEVAPTWTVPASITNNELIPIELRQPGYLEAEKIDFFRRDGDYLVSVPRSHVTEVDFHTHPFPYVLRQRAGDHNVLGRIKILMPNQYAIYMHDTQAKDLFAKSDRAYSHGCIRLSDPFLLGSTLLQLDGKTDEEIATILNKRNTTRVELNDQTPTHISYFTAWVDDEGKLHQRKDVYKHNKKLISGLHANNTLLSTLESRPIHVLAEQTEF